MTDPANVTIDVYKDKAGEWRWTIRSAGNHEPLAVSSEGYVRRFDAVKAARLVSATGKFRWPDGDDGGDAA